MTKRVFLCGLIALAGCSSNGGVGVDGGGSDGGRDAGGSDGGGSDAGDGGGLTPGPWFPSANGLYGGAVMTIAIDPITPANVWVGTAGAGVFKSTDGGTTWHASSIGLDPLGAYQLAIDPSTPTTLWVLTDTPAGLNGQVGGPRLFKSTNGGATWTAVTTMAAPNEIYLAVAVSPSSSTIWLLGSAGVYRSVDGGAHWAVNTSSIAAREGMRAIALDPVDPMIAYVVTFNRFYKTTDGNVSWTNPATGIPNVTLGSALWRVLVDPRSPQTIYVGAINVGSGVFRSGDGGQTFTDVASGLNGAIGDGLAIDPTTPTTLYTWATGYRDRLYKSGDSGAHWGRVSLGAQDASLIAFAVDPTLSSKLYLGSNARGLARSSDSGASWQVANDGITNLDVGALAYVPAQPTTLYAGSQQGAVYKSTTGGAAWMRTTMSSPIAEGLEVSALAVHPTTPSVVYAGTSKDGRFLGAAGSGVFKTIDGGLSWYALDLGPSGTNVDVKHIAIDPAAPATVYAVGSRVLKTTTNGVSWSALSLPNATDLVIDPADSQKLYAMTPSQGPFRSLDGGNSWNPWKSGMTTGGGGDLLDTARVLAIDPATPATFYACVGLGLYKSTNAGSTWSHAAVGFPNDDCGRLVIAPGLPSTLYALGSDNRLFVTTDGATSWKAANAPLDPARVADTLILAVSPVDASSVAIGLRYSVGVIRTTTAGR